MPQTTSPIFSTIALSLLSSSLLSFSLLPFCCILFFSPRSCFDFTRVAPMTTILSPKQIWSNNDVDDENTSPPGGKLEGEEETICFSLRAAWSAARRERVESQRELARTEHVLREAQEKLLSAKQRVAVTKKNISVRENRNHTTRSSSSSSSAHDPHFHEHIEHRVSILRKHLKTLDHMICKRKNAGLSAAINADCVSESVGDVEHNVAALRDAVSSGFERLNAINVSAAALLSCMPPPDNDTMERTEKRSSGEERLAKGLCEPLQATQASNEALRLEIDATEDGLAELVETAQAMLRTAYTTHEDQRENARKESAARGVLEAMARTASVNAALQLRIDEAERHIKHLELQISTLADDFAERRRMHVVNEERRLRTTELTMRISKLSRTIPEVRDRASSEFLSYKRPLLGLLKRSKTAARYRETTAQATISLLRETLQAAGDDLKSLQQQYQDTENQIATTRENHDDLQRAKAALQQDREEYRSLAENLINQLLPN